MNTSSFLSTSSSSSLDQSKDSSLDPDYLKTHNGNDISSLSSSTLSSKSAFHPVKSCAYKTSSYSSYSLWAWKAPFTSFLSQNSVPSPRVGATVSYLSKSNLCLVFGGANHEQGFLNDLYSLDLGNECIIEKCYGFIL